MKWIYDDGGRADAGFRFPPEASEVMGARGEAPRDVVHRPMAGR